MTNSELSQLLLGRLYELAETEGHGHYHSLNEIASQGGVCDVSRIYGLAKALEARGLIIARYKLRGGVRACISAEGSLQVEASKTEQAATGVGRPSDRELGPKSRRPQLMFDGIANDILTLEKRDGRQIPGVRASVQTGLIIVPDATLPIEEGDFFTRSLRSGIEELFEVKDRGFVEGVLSIPAHFEVRVERVHQRRSSIVGAQVDPRAVFLVSGRNEKARSALATFLRAINLRPIEWSEAVALTREASPFVGSVIEAGFNAARAVVVMLTGDDLAKLRPELLAPTDDPFEKVDTPQARANVLFEAGYAFAKHPERTVLVEIGNLRPFSDVQGRHVVRIDNSIGKRQDLANRLLTAGCDVKIVGADWHTAGDFDSVGP
jgi:predicted nucleotide-binding protein